MLCVHFTSGVFISFRISSKPRLILFLILSLDINKLSNTPINDLSKMPQYGILFFNSPFFGKSKTPNFFQLAHLQYQID
jgi:hypothetical protein